MGMMKNLPRKIALALAIAIIITALSAIIWAIYVITYTPQVGKPTLVKDQPAGLYYRGPRTTAIAGWYCIENLNSTPLPGPAGKPMPVGYSVQLNAELSNGVWVQDVMGTVKSSGYPGYSWDYWAQYWPSITSTTHGGAVSLHGPATCGWLVIAVWNGTAYTGYSLDGHTVHWYGKYPVGNATIVPGIPTQLVLGGPGFGEGLNISETLIYLGLYYWNGSAWELAPVGVVPRLSLSFEGTGEWVWKAWVFANATACGTISWPNPVNKAQCPPPPSFTPTPSK